MYVYFGSFFPLLKSIFLSFQIISHKYKITTPKTQLKEIKFKPKIKLKEILW